MISCDLCRTKEKILEGWKVYAGTNNLHQLPEASSVSQIIINSNYSDEQDDYDIALLRLSKPLVLSGEQAQLRPLPSAVSVQEGGRHTRRN